MYVEGNLELEDHLSKLLGVLSGYGLGTQLANVSFRIHDAPYETTNRCGRSIRYILYF
jgi:hypothetical protein